MKVFIDANLLIYLNVPMIEEEARLIEDFWLELVRTMNSTPTYWCLMK